MKNRYLLVATVLLCLVAASSLVSAEAGLLHPYTDDVANLRTLQVLPESGWKAEELVTYSEFVTYGQKLVNGRGENIFVNDLVGELKKPDQLITYQDAMNYASFFMCYITTEGVQRIKDVTPELQKSANDQLTGYDMAHIFNNLLYMNRRGQDLTLLEERYLLGGRELTVSKVMQITGSEIILEDEGTFALMPGVQAFLAAEGEEIKPLGFDRIPVGISGLRFLFNAEGQVQTVLASELAYPEMIRVLVSSQLSKWGSSQSYDFEEIKIQAKEPFKIVSHQGIYDTIELVVEKNEEVTFTNLNGEIAYQVGHFTARVADRVYLKSFYPGTMEFTLLSTERRGISPTYAGTLEMIPGAEGQLYLINELPIEWYLKKVVPSEIPTSWSQEAFKVQAISARSYAIYQIQGGRFESQSANVDDSTTSQVYNNAPEHQGINQAIAETQGIVPIYDEEVIDAVFSSTTGGSTANNEDVWHDWRNKEFPGTPIPYLRARSQVVDAQLPDLTQEANALAFFKDQEIKGFDAISPYYRWRIELTREELENTINKNLPGRERADGILGTDMIQTVTGTPLVEGDANFSIGTLEDLRVVRRGEGGNMMVLDIVGSNGTYRVLKEYNIRFVIRPRSDMTGSKGDVILHRYDGSTYRNYSILPSSFAAFELERDEQGEITQVTIYGGGNGHGVGLSQWGMKAMADQGYTYEEILKNYYTDIELKKIY